MTKATCKCGAAFHSDKDGEAYELLEAHKLSEHSNPVFRELQKDLELFSEVMSVNTDEGTAELRVKIEARQKELDAILEKASG